MRNDKNPQLNRGLVTTPEPSPPHSEISLCDKVNAIIPFVWTVPLK